jgi:hypothetical protein
MSKTATATRQFVIASNPTLAEEIVGRIVAFRPLRQERVETKIGPSDATYAQVVVIDDDGTPVEHGETPIFWTVVRRQLAKATPEAPWVVGRLVLDGQAYRLDPVNEPDLSLVDVALADLPDH